MPPPMSIKPPIFLQLYWKMLHEQTHGHLSAALFADGSPYNTLHILAWYHPLACSDGTLSKQTLCFLLDLTENIFEI